MMLIGRRNQKAAAKEQFRDDNSALLSTCFYVTIQSCRHISSRWQEQKYLTHSLWSPQLFSENSARILEVPNFEFLKHRNFHVFRFGVKEIEIVRGRSARFWGLRHNSRAHVLRCEWRQHCCIQSWTKTSQNHLQKNPVRHGATWWFRLS